jgi:glutathione S-transferase
MLKPKLTYFDFAGGRGEDVRLAFALAGAEFEDHRIGGAEWKSLKDSAPYGALPILEVEGRPPLAQSNAILCWVGVEYGLLPKDSWEQARHLSVLAFVEELRAMFDTSMHSDDDDAKQKERKALCEGPIPRWAAQLEAQVRGPFVAGDTISVADLKVFTAIHWLRRGVLDHIPKDTLDGYAKLTALYDAVLREPRIAAYRGATRVEPS